MLVFARERKNQVRRINTMNWRSNRCLATSWIAEKISMDNRGRGAPSQESRCTSRAGGGILFSLNRKNSWTAMALSVPGRITVTCSAGSSAVRGEPVERSTELVEGRERRLAIQW